MQFHFFGSPGSKFVKFVKKLFKIYEFSSLSSFFFAKNKCECHLISYHHFASGSQLHENNNNSNILTSLREGKFTR